MKKQPKAPTHHRAILEPGFAGLLTPAEAKFIGDQLLKSSLLRRKWGLELRKSYAPGVLAAEAFPENPRAARDHLRRWLATGLEHAPALQTKPPAPQTRLADRPKKSRRPQVNGHARPDLPQRKKSPRRKTVARAAPAPAEPRAAKIVAARSNGSTAARPKRQPPSSVAPPRSPQLSLVPARTLRDLHLPRPTPRKQGRSVRAGRRPVDQLALPL